MKGLVLKACIPAFFAVLLFSCASSGPAVSTGNGSDSGSADNRAEIARRQDVYMAVIREEGYAPSIDSDGDIMFKNEDYTYYVIISGANPAALELILPNFYNLESASAGERELAPVAVSYANRRTKGAKVYISSSNKRVHAALEAYLPKAEDFRAIFSRGLDMISTAQEQFTQYLRDNR